MMDPGDIDVGHLKTCDVCFRTEIDNMLDGEPDLIPMVLDADGLWLCPDCDDWVRDGMPPAKEEFASTDECKLSELGKKC